jgi:hypothetical protein
MQNGRISVERCLGSARFGRSFRHVRWVSMQRSSLQTLFSFKLSLSFRLKLPSHPHMWCYHPKNSHGKRVEIDFVHLHPKPHKIFVHLFWYVKLKEFIFRGDYTYHIHWRSSNLNITFDHLKIWGNSNWNQNKINESLTPIHDCGLSLPVWGIELRSQRERDSMKTSQPVESDILCFYNKIDICKILFSKTFISSGFFIQGFR